MIIEINPNKKSSTIDSNKNKKKATTRSRIRSFCWRCQSPQQYLHNGNNNNVRSQTQLQSDQSSVQTDSTGSTSLYSSFGRCRSSLETDVGSGSTRSLTAPTDFDGVQRGCLKVSTQAESVYEKFPTSTCVSGADPVSKSVTWSDIEVQYHKICLGDNPSVENGPPISLDWDVLLTSSMSIDEFENIRFCCSSHRKSKRTSSSPAILSGRTREEMLLNEGYSISDIEQAIKQLLVIQKYRLVNAYDGMLGKMRRKLVQMQKSNKRKVLQTLAAFNQQEKPSKWSSSSSYHNDTLTICEI